MDQIFKFINNLNSGQRAVIIGGFSVLFLFLIGLLIYSNIKSQDEKLNFTIASNLTKNQVLLASSELDAANIPYAVVGSGNRLSLRTNQMNINVAKIKLITSDASTQKHSGWEIFDKSSLGTTNFENKIKYLRAMEGELARSLQSLSGVLVANVKIAIPKESVFTQKKTLPSASAVLTLREGTVLTQKQIDGIKNFIASSVPKLLSENIKLINQNGSLLEHSQSDIDDLKYIQHEKYKIKLENDYENKIVDLLRPFIGGQRVIAKVSVELDFTKQEISQEIFEPEGTIRSQQTTEIASAAEGTNANKSAAPGVDSNIENPDNGSKGEQTKSSKEEAKNVTNYEISKKVINEHNSAYAKISKLTAAVTFDSAVLEKLENKEEFLQNINAIVQEAVGYQVKRGDSVTVKAFKFLGLKPFGEAGGEDEAGAEDDLGLISTKSLIQEFGEYVQYLIASILLFVFYKKFIANNEIMLLDGEGSKAGAAGEDQDAYNMASDEFDSMSAQSSLKAKVKSQILNNLDGLDPEEMAKYEILIEEIDQAVTDNPAEIAKMIEMLLGEGDAVLKSGRKDS
ncbi:MAG: flagellar basal-body MS-ring/collar protein FliF [Campylobacterota bacterium]|nr:flagellar basal-body MS-ring/collar protein FliF [Campylobacterota bacterium]